MLTSRVKSPAPKATRLAPGAGAEDRVDPGKAARGLDDRDQVDRPRRQSVLAFELARQPFDRGQPGGGFDLWQNDAVEPATDDRHQVAVAEFGVERVDPDIERRPPRPPEGRRHPVPRRLLFGGRDRVFEIEDHRVGIERQRLLDPPRMVSRRKQKTA